MALVRDATAARPDPLLLSAVLLACLLAGLLGWLGTQLSADRPGPAGPVVSADFALQSGKPVPDRQDIAVHVSAVVEKDPDPGRQGKVPAALPSSNAAADLVAIASAAPWDATPIPARTLRSHLSQAPPARA